jgi:hypothetical protein
LSGWWYILAIANTIASCGKRNRLVRWHSNKKGSLWEPFLLLCIFYD